VLARDCDPSYRNPTLDVCNAANGSCRPEFPVRCLAMLKTERAQEEDINRLRQLFRFSANIGAKLTWRYCERRLFNERHW
jgi:hypothetical protein